MEFGLPPPDIFLYLLVNFKSLQFNPFNCRIIRTFFK